MRCDFTQSDECQMLRVGMHCRDGVCMAYGKKPPTGQPTQATSPKAASGDAKKGCCGGSERASKDVREVKVG